MRIYDYRVAPWPMRPAVAFVAACVLTAGACAGGEKRNAAESGAATSAPATGASATGAPATTGGATGAAPAGATTGGAATAGGAAAAGAAAGALPPGVTPKMVAEGDSIYHGQKAGGTCYTCHGPDAKGTALCPPLVDHKFRTGDGSYEFLIKRVTEGVPNPAPPYTTPMPPLGGAPLTPEQVRAVAAYGYSVTHKGA